MKEDGDKGNDTLCMISRHNVFLPLTQLFVKEMGGSNHQLFF